MMVKSTWATICDVLECSRVGTCRRISLTAGHPQSVSFCESMVSSFFFEGTLAIRAARTARKSNRASWLTNEPVFCRPYAFRYASKSRLNLVPVP